MVRAPEMEGAGEDVLGARHVEPAARDAQEVAVVLEERPVDAGLGAGRLPAVDDRLEALAVDGAQEEEGGLLVEVDVRPLHGDPRRQAGLGRVEDRAEPRHDALAVGEGCGGAPFDEEGAEGFALGLHAGRSEGVGVAGADDVLEEDAVVRGEEAAFGGGHGVHEHPGERIHGRQGGRSTFLTGAAATAPSCACRGGWGGGGGGREGWEMLVGRDVLDGPARKVFGDRGFVDFARVKGKDRG